MPHELQGTQAETPNAGSSAAPPADLHVGDRASAAEHPELLADALIAVHKCLATISPEKDKKRDAWDIAGLVAGWTAALVIPAVLGVPGYYLSIILKNREGQTKMVELAIELLKVDPKPTDEDKALRNWAMDVIDKYSEIKLPAEVRSNLQIKPLELATDALEGAATTPGGKALNRLMNRSNLPSADDIDREVTLAKLLEPGYDLDRFDWTKAAMVTAFVIDIKYSGRTSANLMSPNIDDRDTYIYLALDAGAPENQRLIAVVTPRLRNLMKKRGVDWSTRALRDPKTGILGKRVEITGWLLLNTRHVLELQEHEPRRPDRLDNLASHELGNSPCDRYQGPRWNTHEAPRIARRIG
jgi:hypothetical protein